ncbi:MAG: hypothetical protein KTR16_03915, partial [Acidiferrobacterales bacterium]|nr:hypothetical protein [Acidiferrobacterales bacterium]
VETLQDAIKDCTVVIASTARPRGYDLPQLSPEETGIALTKAATKSPVALVFGPERMGLHNDDIRLAKYRVTIPANPQYSSLNMAAAVQTLSYEIYKASMFATVDQQADDSKRIALDRVAPDLPTSDDVERLYVHLEQVLKSIKFLRPHQGETMQRLRHLINRAEPDALELNILRGILSAVERHTNN